MQKNKYAKPGELLFRGANKSSLLVFFFCLSAFYFIFMTAI